MALTDYQQQVTAALAECGDAVGDGALEAVKTWIKDDDDKTKTDAKYEGALCYLQGFPGTGAVAFGILGKQIKRGDMSTPKKYIVKISGNTKHIKADELADSLKGMVLGFSRPRSAVQGPANGLRAAALGLVASGDEGEVKVSATITMAGTTLAGVTQEFELSAFLKQYRWPAAEGEPVEGERQADLSDAPRLAALVRIQGKAAAPEDAGQANGTNDEVTAVCRAAGLAGDLPVTKRYAQIFEAAEGQFPASADANLDLLDQAVTHKMVDTGKEDWMKTALRQIYTIAPMQVRLDGESEEDDRGGRGRDRGRHYGGRREGVERSRSRQRREADDGDDWDGSQSTESEPRLARPADDRGVCRRADYGTRLLKTLCPAGTPLAENTRLLLPARVAKEMGIHEDDYPRSNQEWSAEATERVGRRVHAWMEEHRIRTPDAARDDDDVESIRDIFSATAADSDRRRDRGGDRDQHRRHSSRSRRRSRSRSRSGRRRSYDRERSNSRSRSRSRGHGGARKISISAGTGGGDGTAQLHYRPLERVSRANHRGALADGDGLLDTLVVDDLRRVLLSTGEGRLAAHQSSVDGQTSKDVTAAWEKLRGVIEATLTSAETASRRPGFSFNRGTKMKVLKAVNGGPLALAAFEDMAREVYPDATDEGRLTTSVGYIRDVFAAVNRFMRLPESTLLSGLVNEIGVAAATGRIPVEERRRYVLGLLKQWDQQRYDYVRMARVEPPSFDEAGAACDTDWAEVRITARLAQQGGSQRPPIGGGGKGFKGKCWRCNEVGHRADDCPKRQRTGDAPPGSQPGGRRGDHGRGDGSRPQDGPKQRGPAFILDGLDERAKQAHRERWNQKMSEKQACYDFLFKPGGCDGRCNAVHRTSHPALHAHRMFTREYLQHERINGEVKDNPARGFELSRPPRR